MVHHDIDGKSYFGVNYNFERTKVLLQLGDGYEQIRVALTKEQAEKLIGLIQQAIDKLVEGK